GDHTLAPPGMDAGGAGAAMPGEPIGPPSDGVEIPSGEDPDTLPAPSLEGIPQGRPVPMDSAMKFSAAGPASATRKVIVASPPAFSAESPILAARNAARSPGMAPGVQPGTAPGPGSASPAMPPASPMSLPTMPDMPPMGS